MIIVGAPGSGKTTLAQNVATFLSDSGFVVKTMEAPRELQVPDNITQYTALDGSMTNTADVLLLVRPDFVIFDELRKNEDFNVFADMRLAGIGMVGVIHANGVQDAIQRFCDRVDFSVLPQIINTVIFVKQGVITKIYDVGFTVKVPGGMAGEMHLRPVTTVTDHETGELILDVFRYDGETIVIPVTRRSHRPAGKTRTRPGPVHRPAARAGQAHAGTGSGSSPGRRATTGPAGSSWKRRSSGRSGGTPTALSTSR